MSFPGILPGGVELSDEDKMALAATDRLTGALRLLDAAKVRAVVPLDPWFRELAADGITDVGYLKVNICAYYAVAVLARNEGLPTFVLNATAVDALNAIVIAKYGFERAVKRFGRAMWTGFDPPGVGDLFNLMMLKHETLFEALNA